jgi:hypothetical protein
MPIGHRGADVHQRQRRTMTEGEKETRKRKIAENKHSRDMDAHRRLFRPPPLNVAGTSNSHAGQFAIREDQLENSTTQNGGDLFVALLHYKRQIKHSNCSRCAMPLV